MTALSPTAAQPVSPPPQPGDPATPRPGRPSPAADPAAPPTPTEAEASAQPPAPTQPATPAHTQPEAPTPKAHVPDQGGKPAAVLAEAALSAQAVGGAPADGASAEPSEAEAGGAPAARGRRPNTHTGPSLSPSRAADFKTCPLLFRFRTVDKLPEVPSADQVRGTLVHAVLERLFDLPAAGRTQEAAAALVTPEWERLLAEEPELADLFTKEPPVRGRPAPPSPASGRAPALTAHANTSTSGLPWATASTAGSPTANSPTADPPTSGSSSPGDTAPDPASPALTSTTVGAASASSFSVITSADAEGVDPAAAVATSGEQAVRGSAAVAATSGDQAARSPAAEVATSGELVVPDPAVGAVTGGEQVVRSPAVEAVTGGEQVVRDPAAVAAEDDATGQTALIDVPDGAGEAARVAAFLTSARDLLGGYFAVEDPQRLEPAERETLISTMIGDDLLLRGYIDRLDVSPAGDLRVVDYKTGGAPREAFEGRALFQLKFYALVLWRTRGVVPRALRLLYLKDAEALDYSPDPGELERFERTLLALSQAIERAKKDRDFRPKPSRLCGWCSHQSLCPQFGGTPPPYPETISITSFTADTEPDRAGTVLRDDPLG